MQEGGGERRDPFAISSWTCHFDGAAHLLTSSAVPYRRRRGRNESAAPLVLAFVIDRVSDAAALVTGVMILAS
jgi:hypothetical protein